MLLDPGRLLSQDHDGKALAGVEFAISFSKRETDFSGWYKENSVIGVIFTEVSEANRNSMQTIILARLKASLRGQFREDQIDQIHIAFHVFPDDWTGKDTGNPPNVTLYPDFVRINRPRGLTHFVKRSIDILGSLATLVCFSPLFLAISLAIKLTSGGPVLFRQERVGQYGVGFVFLKFRSMHLRNDSSIHRQFVGRFIAGKTDCAKPEQIDQPIYKITADPRVTPIGKFLRKTSFDELPQFWNVLRGEMSLVGPRPPIPYELSSYDIWHRRRIIEVKPGITGLWQVLGRSRTTFDEMVRLDLRYASTWSLWLDLKILLKTPRAIISGEGAY
jgi:lipopolysaccharide/colanic/teichoic acid biosynthesis glycosyltransferase